MRVNIPQIAVVWLILRQHSPEPSPAEDVDVEMRHLLMRIGAMIGEDTVAACRNPLGAGDLADGADIANDLGRRCFLREIIERDIGAFRDHQNMHRRLGVDVMEGERVLVLEHLLARDLAPQIRAKMLLRS